MISSTPSNVEEPFDLCIIGSGPAGIIVALEYARLNSEHRVLLTEYGRESAKKTNNLDSSIQNLNPGNHHDPYECTNKGLGGTSATWGGRCVMYDPVDFEDRPILAGGCTWQKDLLEELQPFLADTAAYFECGGGPFSTQGLPADQNQRIAEHFVEGEVLDSFVERWSMPTRFGTRYRKDLEQTPNLTIWSGVEARDFEAPTAQGQISLLHFRELDGEKKYQIRADRFVLAAGTQETTRFLLRNPQIFNSIGGPPKALGRYYQGHVSGKIASVRFSGDPKKTDYGFQRDEDGSYYRRRFQLAKETILRENLLNAAIWLDNPLYHEPAHRNGTMSLMYLAMITPFIGRRLAPPAIANSVTKGRVNAVGRHLLNVIRDLPGSIVTPASIFFRRYCLKRKLPGIFLFNPENRYALHFHSEQSPDPTSRMSLGQDGETLVIDYRLNDSDIESVIRSHQILDDWLQKCGCGDLEYWFPPDELHAAIRKMSRDGIHQSGTTRIADSPEAGVVSRDLRVWGTRNLFVCSSSVFPTSGQANPTFFLGAFALRLARQLHVQNAHS